MTDVILLVHGSPDPRAGVAALQLARDIETRRDAPRVHVAALANGPALDAVCARLAADGVTEAVVVPTFVSTAFHVRVDVPTTVEQARARTGVHLRLTPALGTSAAMLDVLDRCLPDGPVVLATAGTTDAEALADLAALARRWSASRGTDVVVAHAAQAEPRVHAAIAELEARTGTRAVVAALVLFPGILPDRIDEQADGRFVTAPLYRLPETADLILERVRALARRAA